jgi:hypothetical protein
MTMEATMFDTLLEISVAAIRTYPGLRKFVTITLYLGWLAYWVAICVSMVTGYNGLAAVLAALYLLFGLIWMQGRGWYDEKRGQRIRLEEMDDSGIRYRVCAKLVVLWFGFGPIKEFGLWAGKPPLWMP